MLIAALCFFFFFFNDTATTEIYTLSLHDALPICPDSRRTCRPGLSSRSMPARQSTSPFRSARLPSRWKLQQTPALIVGDRKSTRLNSSHLVISYAVFCLKKKTVDTWRCSLSSSFL